MTKDMLLVIDNSKSAVPMIRAAIELADRYEAKLSIQVLSVGPLGIPALAPLTTLYVSDHEMAYDEKVRVEDIRAITADSPCVIRVDGLHDELPLLTRRVGRASHVADLMVIGWKDHWELDWLRHHAAAALILGAGTPLLSLRHAQALPPVHHAVLAWKETAEARRAIHDLSVLMEVGGRISIVSVGGDEGEALAMADGAAEVVRHLESKGFTAESHQISKTSHGTAAALVDFTKVHRAQLLAVGAFTHSRLHEIALGSVTRNLLAESSVPVLFCR